MPGKLARAPGMSSASEGAALTAQNCMEIFNWQDEELQNLSLCLILLSYDSSPRSRPTRQMQKRGLGGRRHLLLQKHPVLYRRFYDT